MTIIRTDLPHHTLELETIITAPRSIVWRCWTEGDLLKQWYCPKPWQVTKAQLDPRPGGRMNTVMEGPDNGRFDNVGIFLVVEPETRLVFTDAFAEGYIPQANAMMTGYVELSDTPAGHTKMVWGARHAAEEARQQHLDMGFEQGWSAAAQQLNDLAMNLTKEGAV